MRKYAILAIAALAFGSACAVPEDDTETRTNTGGGGKNNAGGGGGNKNAGPDNSTATKDGPLTWGNWQAVGPVQVKEDGLQQFEAVMRVKNTGESPDEGFFTVTILKGKRILTTIDCSTARIGPGQVGTADCFSIDDFVPGWTEITVENAF